MKCNYCLLDKPLCKAHLIPKSFFLFMYPNGKVEGESLIVIDYNKDYLGNKRVGFWDDQILCAECDGILGSLDNYGGDIFLNKEPELIKGAEKEKAFVINGVDIPRLKLFILSVLWRCSITKLKEFRKSKLPEKFERELREMLINQDSGGVNDYSIVIMRFDYNQNNKSFSKYMQTPVRHRVNHINYIMLYLANGYKILIKTDKRNQQEDLIPVSLSIDKPVFVLGYEEFERSSEFNLLLKGALKIRK